MSSSVPSTSGANAIYAAPHFLKPGAGASGRFNLFGNIAFAMSVGLTFGFVWKTYHWEEKRKIRQFYKELVAKESADEAQRKAVIQQKLKELEKELMA